MLEETCVFSGVLCCFSFLHNVLCQMSELYDWWPKINGCQYPLQTISWISALYFTITYFMINLTLVVGHFNKTNLK